ncbi:hypothetical protein Ancab_040193 [Ancistrocladus abbreviatus]
MNYASARPRGTDMGANGAQQTFGVHHATEIVRFMRKEPPAHYRIEFESFTSFLSSFPQHLQCIESTEFVVEGNKWILGIHPNDQGHLTLALQLNEPCDRFPINAMCKFFIYNYQSQMYLVVHGSEALHFDDILRVRGIQMLLVSDFTNVSNGFFLNDRCMFGVEVTILGTTAKKTVLRALNIGRDNFKETWEIQNFQELSSESDEVHSHQFNMGGRLWKLVMYPRGCGKNWGKSLALFLVLLDCSDVTDGRKLYVNMEIHLKNLRNEPDITEKIIACYQVSSASWGINLILLRDLHNPEKGFKLDDKLILEIEVKHMYLMDEC